MVELYQKNGRKVDRTELKKNRQMPSGILARVTTGHAVGSKAAVPRSKGGNAVPRATTRPGPMLSREAAIKVRQMVAHYEKAFERFAECIAAYQALLMDVCPELRGDGTAATEQESKLARQWQHALH